MYFKFWLNIVKLYILFLCAFFIAGCGGGGGGSHENVNVNNTPEYSKAKISDVGVGNNVHSFTSEQLESLLIELKSNGDITFQNSADVNMVSEGDIIVGATSSLAEYGFLRNVLLITDNGDGTITFSTSQAALADIFESIDAETVTTLLPTQIDSAKTSLAKGVRLKKIKADLQAEIGKGIDFELNIERDDIEVTGEVSVTFGVVFDFNVDLFTLQSAKISATTTVSGSPSIAFKADVVSAKVPMGTISFHPITVMAGGIPIIICPRIPLYLVVSAGGTITIEANISYNAMLGVEYKKETGVWNKIDSDPSYSFDFGVSEGLNVHVGLKTNAELLFYGVTGPSVGVEVYREISTEISRMLSGIGSELTYKEGIKGTIEGKLKILSREFDVSAGIFDLYTYVCGSITESGKTETGQITTQTLSGRVLDANTGLPIEGAAIFQGYSSSPIDPWTITMAPKTSSDGRYHIDNISMSNYSMALSYYKEGYNSLIVNHGDFPNLRTVYLMPVASNGFGSIGGQVLDATTANILTSYDIKLKSIDTGITIKQQNVIGAASYMFNGIPAGEYEIVASFPDGSYYEGSVYARVLAEQSQSAYTINVIPTSSDSVVSIILTWDESPADLDSHLIDTATSGGAVHTWFGGMDVADYANLDVDDTTSYGPETTTIEQIVDGGYTFYVHDYTYRGNPNSYALSNSNATVRVIFVNGNGVVEERKFYVPTGVAGTCWEVFRITSVGVIVPENQIVSEDVLSMSKSINDDNEFINFLRSLPDKGRR